MKNRRYLTFFLIMFLGIIMFQASSASAEEPYERVFCQTRPGQNTVDLPTVGQDFSSLVCTVSSDGVSVADWSMIDEWGNPCYGIIRYGTYTLNIVVVLDNPERGFTWDTCAFINNEPASFYPSDDGMSATISRVITPYLIAPTVWHDPGDEEHKAGELFSFTASASPTYTSFAWFVRSPEGREFPVEELPGQFPGIVFDIADLGREHGCRCNLYNVPDRMDGWSVFCVFRVEGAETKTKGGRITVLDAVPPTPEPTPESTPEPTPAPDPQPIPEPSGEPDNLPEGIYIAAEDWDPQWTHDEDYHWHKSMDPGSDAVSDKGTHNLIWKVMVPATSRAEGEEEGICSDCGYRTYRSVAYIRASGEPDILLGVILGIAGVLVLSMLVIFTNILTTHDRGKRRRKK